MYKKIVFKEKEKQVIALSVDSLFCNYVYLIKSPTPFTIYFLFFQGEKGRTFAH
jgi:hypothetical protein